MIKMINIIVSRSGNYHFYPDKEHILINRIGIYNKNMLNENLNAIPLSDNYKQNDKQIEENYNKNKFQKNGSYIR